MDLLTYACLLAGSRGIVKRTSLLSVRSHPLHPSPGVTHLFCFSFCLFARCFVAYLFAFSLRGVPCDGLTGDGVWWFPECVCPIQFHFLFFISFSMGSTLLGHFPECCVGYMSVHFRCKNLRRHLLMKVCVLSVWNQTALSSTSRRETHCTGRPPAPGSIATWTPRIGSR